MRLRNADTFSRASLPINKRRWVNAILESGNDCFVLGYPKGHDAGFDLPFARGNLPLKRIHVCPTGGQVGKRFSLGRCVSRLSIKGTLVYSIKEFRVHGSIAGRLWDF
jgi:hypothetical protein